MNIRRVIRDWWPIVVPFAIVITAQAIFQSNVVANGAHAPDHLRSATVPFPTFFLLVVIMWASPAARRRMGIWVFAGLLSISSLVIMLGNLLVVKAIAGDSWSNEQANSFGPTRPGFELGHSIVQFSEMAGAASLILLVLVLRTHGIIRTGPSILATGLALLGLALPGLGLIPILALFVIAIEVCSQRVQWIRSQLRKARGAQKI